MARTPGLSGDAAYAAAEEDQLRTVGELLHSCSSGDAGSEAGELARMSLLALIAFLEEAAPARALQVVRADGVAGGLEAALRSGNADTAFVAAWTLQYAARHAEAARALLRGAPGLVELALARLAACAPRAAALEAGVDVVAVRCYACGNGLGTGLVGFFTIVAHHGILFGHGGRELAPLLVPTLAALLAHPESDVALGTVRLLAVLCATQGRLGAVTHCSVQLFELGGRGVIRGIERQLASVARELSDSGANGSRRQRATENAILASALAFYACDAALSGKRQLLTAPAAEAWVAAAPRLVAQIAGAQRGVEQAGAAAAGAGGVDNWLRSGAGSMFGTGNWLRSGAGSMFGTDVAKLRLVAAWVPKARRIAETARSSGAAGPGGGGGGEAPLERCCAACGRSRAADGARLRRCRGCGAFTGVMYCGDACAREHWVRRGHRRVCEPASAQLRSLKEEVEAVMTA